MKVVQAQASDDPMAAARPPAPVVERRPEVRERAVAPPSTTMEKERRALLAEVAPMVAAVTEELRAMGFHDEDAMIAELERRIEGGPFATDRTRLGVGPVAPIASTIVGR